MFSAVFFTALGVAFYIASFDAPNETRIETALTVLACASFVTGAVIW